MFLSPFAERTLRGLRRDSGTLSERSMRRRRRRKSSSGSENLKKKEIINKLKQVEEVSGASALGFENVDLEGDFDPEEHDRKMQELFNEDYYGQDVSSSSKPSSPHARTLIIHLLLSSIG